MTDEQRLQIITEQLILVRDNLFRGMSKSIQKLQARSINEVLELPNHTQSPPTLSLAPAPEERKRTWRGLTGKEVMDVTRKEGHELLDFIYEYGTASEGTEERVVAICKAIEAKLKEKNSD